MWILAWPVGHDARLSCGCAFASGATPGVSACQPGKPAMDVILSLLNDSKELIATVMDCRRGSRGTRRHDLNAAGGEFLLDVAMEVGVAVRDPVGLRGIGVQFMADGHGRGARACCNRW